MLVLYCELIINVAGWTWNATWPVFNKWGHWCRLCEALGDVTPAVPSLHREPPFSLINNAFSL